MRRPDNHPHQRRPSCLPTGTDDAGGGDEPAETSPAHAVIMMDRLVDFARELSEASLSELPVIAGEHGFIAVPADIIDATGNFSANLVLAEPRVGTDDDTLGLIVLPPGSEPGDGILFTRPRVGAR